MKLLIEYAEMVLVWVGLLVCSVPEVIERHCRSLTGRTMCGAGMQMNQVYSIVVPREAGCLRSLQTCQ